MLFAVKFKPDMRHPQNVFDYTLDARGFLREEPWNRDKRARSGEERENREDVRKPLFTSGFLSPLLCLSLDILFAAKENIWDQGSSIIDHTLEIGIRDQNVRGYYKFSINST